MKKQISLIFLTALLTACGSSAPNLVHSQQPILNIEADLNPLIEADADADSAWVKNKSEHRVGVAYDIFWYDKNGVTQLTQDAKPQISSLIVLQPQQKAALDLTKPTAESVNYRLYLRLK